MAGDPINAEMWTDADVYVADFGDDAPDAPEDFDDDWPEGWEFVGLLDGDAGFGESRDEQRDRKYAWGGLLVRTSRRQFMLTRTFTALEWNDVTRELIWPDSTEDLLVVPKPKKRQIGFEMREGDKIKRLISANYVEIDMVGDITESEGELTAYEFEVTVYPTAAGGLLIPQVGVLTPAE